MHSYVWCLVIWNLNIFFWACFKVSTDGAWLILINWNYNCVQIHLRCAAKRRAERSTKCANVCSTFSTRREMNTLSSSHRAQQVGFVWSENHSRSPEKILNLCFWKITTIQWSASESLQPHKGQNLLRSSRKKCRSSSPSQCRTFGRTKRQLTACSHIQQKTTLMA